MKFLKPFCLFCILFLSLSAAAQQTKVLTADKHNEYGLVYSLPITGLKISVKVTKETRTAGPYCQYAKKFLGISDVIRENDTFYTISDVAVQTVGLSNDKDQFLMQLKPGATTFIEVDQNGMLRSINCRTAENPAGNTPFEMTSSNSPDVSVDEYLKYVDMDFISSQSSIKQAEMIANSLMEVRDSYISLTRGTADNVPTDGRQLELMLNSLKQQETALTTAFTGTTSTREEVKEFLYVPEKDGRDVLFRLSDFNGFVDADDYSGVPVYISTEVMLQGQLPKDETGVEKKLPKDAVIYAIPGVAKISVSCNGNTFLEMEAEFAQFGTKFGLNPTLFSDKKERSFAKFDPATGALLELGVATE